MSVLLPPGVEKLTEAPHTLHDAITQALMFLGFEELPKDERPPRNIWFDTKKMRAHFEAVEKRREEKWGTKDDGSPKEIEDPVQNEAAKMLLAEE